MYIENHGKKKSSLIPFSYFFWLIFSDLVIETQPHFTYLLILCFKKNNNRVTSLKAKYSLISKKN